MWDTLKNLRGVWAASVNDVFVVGDQGLILEGNGFVATVAGLHGGFHSAEVSRAGDKGSPWICFERAVDG